MLGVKCQSLAREAFDLLKTLQLVAILLICPSELGAETLLLKIPHTLVAECGGIKSLLPAS